MELIINGKSVDLFGGGIGLRLNNILIDPTKLTNNEAEYSFTFTLPKTKRNSEIFGHADVSSKKNKFSSRFPAIVYADGIEVFNGTLKLSGVDENGFSCNLYKARVNTLETIFGESTLNEIDWRVPFKGVSTINEVNADMSTKYFFPLVAYSLFNKVPKNETQSGNRIYSLKKNIDTTNRFYYNSFVPSLNMVELLKNCCKLKGYELGGTIVQDKILNEIYLSNNISSDQDPLYNYGDGDMGEVSFDFDFDNTSSRNNVKSYLTYELEYVPPYPQNDPEHNFKNYDTSIVFNVSKYAQKSNIENKSKMYNSGVVSIPADGWYEIEFDAEFGVMAEQGTLSGVSQCTGVSFNANDGYVRNYKDVNVDYSLESMPVELKVMKWNASDGDIDALTYELIGSGDYPNEQPIEEVKGRRENRLEKAVPLSQYTNNPKNQEGKSVTTAVDRKVNPDFVCGLSQSNKSRSVAYIKNGTSWDVSDLTNTEALYNCNGYFFRNANGTYTQTEVNQNILLGADSTECVSVGARKSKGTCKMLIKLAKNDMLGIVSQQRAYYTSKDSLRLYKIEAKGTFRVRAVAIDTTPSTILKYGMDSNFDKLLNLGNFCNNETKISDFFSTIQKAFNLSFEQKGKTILLNSSKLTNNYNHPIDIDNKTNTNDAEYYPLDIPKSLNVKWSIDTDEEGFYRSVEDNATEEQMQSNNWKDYGDYGSEKVIINDNDDATEQTQSLNLSYNWYNQFKVLDYNEYKESRISLYYPYQLPIIGKTEWWIEQYDYEGQAKNDGRSLKQRLWFRNAPTSHKLPCNDNYLKADEWYNITTTTNEKTIDNEVVYLNYNNGTNTLLGKYFNTNFDSANDEVDIEVYLTANEYKDITNGAMVKFDDSLYKVLEVERI